MPLTRTALNQGRHSVKDAEMDIAPSHARTRRLVRKTAVRAVVPPSDMSAAARNRPIHSGRPDKCESAFELRSHLPVQNISNPDSFFTQIFHSFVLILSGRESPLRAQNDWQRSWRTLW